MVSAMIKLSIIIFLFFAVNYAVVSSQNQDERGWVVKTAASEKRVALVVGNNDYKTKPLQNPRNDAADMKTALESLGFEVIYGANLKTKTEMRAKINEFGAKLAAGGVGLFYYAGHGVQVDGKNYLIPTDAAINNEGEVELEGVDVNYVLAAMANAKNRFNIVILDACRDNPFKRGWRSTGSDGLVQIKAPSGILIAYATQPGNTASDGTGRNGLYTSQLLLEMRKPNVPVETMFKRVAENVANLSQDKQEPWVSFSFKGDFYFSVSATSGTITNTRIENKQNNQTTLSNRGKKSEKILFTFGSITGKKVTSEEIYWVSDELRNLLIAELAKKGQTVIGNSGLTKGEHNQYLGGINSRTDEKALRLLPVALIFSVTIYVLEDMPQFQGLYVSKVSGNIEVIDTENNKTIGSKSFSEVRGFGNTQEQARRNALKSAAGEIPDSFYEMVREKSR